MNRARYIGEHEGDVADQGFGEDGGQSGESVVGAESDARYGAISENQDCGDGVDVMLDVGRNTPLVELVLLNTPSVGEARCVNDAELGASSDIS
jgi:hypothetical protein